MATTTWPAEVYVFDGTRWVSISPHGMTSLPPATGTTLGAVIVGSGVNVAPDGTISVTHFSGDYNDLINKPIVAAPVQSDWNSAGGDSYILNKPVALSQFSNDLKISDFPNDALYTTVPQAAAAAPVQSIVAGANVAISDDGHGHITIASTGTGSGPGGGITSVSGSAPIKVVGGTSAPVISLNVGAGLKVNAGALEADVPDASTTTKGIIQIADAASITAGTALRAVDAAGLKAVTDQQTKDFVNVSGDTMTGTLVIPDGTAAAPSLKFDDATGLFQPAGNTWAVSTHGVERVRVRSDGHVGVGSIGYANAGLAIEQSLNTAINRYGLFVHPTAASGSTSTFIVVGSRGKIEASASPSEWISYYAQTPTLGGGFLSCYGYRTSCRGSIYIWCHHIRRAKPDTSRRKQVEYLCRWNGPKLLRGQSLDRQWHNFTRFCPRCQRRHHRIRRHRSGTSTVRIR